MAEKQGKKVEISQEEFELYNNFLQYGNFEKAKVIFVGREEGLDEQDAQVNYEGRKNWFTVLKDQIKCIEGTDMSKGFYFKDSLRAGQVRRDDKRDFTDYEANCILSLKNAPGWAAKTMVTLNNDKWEITKEHLKLSKDYIRTELFREGKETAMFDFYPLPKQDRQIFVYKEGQNTNYEQHRKSLIKSLYDKYPMPISIVYAGIGSPEIRTFYEEMGFDIKEKDTSQVHPYYIGKVKPAPDKKKRKKNKQDNNEFEKQKFYIGKRKGKSQYCVFTPFFGQSQIRKADLQVILTWVKAIILDEEF